jgi:hypothetical protein
MKLLRKIEHNNFGDQIITYENEDGTIETVINHEGSHWDRKQVLAYTEE